MNRWRPEGWKNPYIEQEQLIIRGVDYPITPVELATIIYEASADAMLAALRAQAKRNHLGSDTRTGKWICISIPDEEE